MHLRKIFERLRADTTGMSRSKSEDWGGPNFNTTEEQMEAMKPHYTEGDLSNIELVEEDTEGEESESEHDSQLIEDMEDYSSRIQIAE